MSLTAEELGRKVLGEVEEAPLSEILQDLQTSLHYSTPPLLSETALKRLLDAAANPSRPTSRPPVVELISPTSASGKSHLLYCVLARAVLPPRPVLRSSNENEVKCQWGRGGCAVVIDVDEEFDSLRLAQVMRALMRGPAEAKPSGSSSTAAPPESSAVIDAQTDRSERVRREVVIDTIVSQSLKHVHVFRPSSLPSLISTIDSLASYLAPSPQSSLPHASLDRPFALLVLTSSTAFVQQIRHADESARLDPDFVVHPPDSLTTVTAYAALVRSLRHLQDFFAVPIVTTSTGLTPLFLGESVRPFAFRQVLPGAWRDLVTLRVAVERTAVRRFAPDLLLQGAERDRKMRNCTTAQAKHFAWLVGDGETQSAGIGKSFSFHVGEDGTVSMDD